MTDSYNMRRAYVSEGSKTTGQENDWRKTHNIVFRVPRTWESYGLPATFKNLGRTKLFLHPAKIKYIYGPRNLSQEPAKSNGKTSIPAPGQEELPLRPS